MLFLALRVSLLNVPVNVQRAAALSSSTTISSMVELVSPKEFVLQSTAIGGGGVESFDFRAMKTGETQIEMRYQREWEKTPLETRVFKVHIGQH